MTDLKRTYLDFERPIAEIEAKIEELESTVGSGASGVDAAEEIGKLRAKAREQLEKTYSSLTAWQKTQVARHPGRPHFVDYQASLIEMFTELAGDRGFGEDPAIVGGLGWIGASPVVVLGHEKGRDTASRVRHNFGMARPEGYRKAVRLMDLADRFGAPVVTFVDTAGAYPGKGAEERGQAEAIARCTERCLTLGVPLVAVVTGEGGSGGAVAIAAANSVVMLEHSIYSVITPEGCASILWRDSAKAEEAAEAMKITAADLQALKIIDRVVKEPVGGAHRDPAATMRRVGEAVRQELKQFAAMNPDQLRAQRRDRFLAIGRGEVGL